jgi:hypothetical protein
VGANNGERRIRVHTMYVPVTNILADMYRLCDLSACMALSAKIGTPPALSLELLFWRGLTDRQRRSVR